MTQKPEILPNIYDRPGQTLYVVRHPLHPIHFAVWDSETDEYKLTDKGEIKRYIDHVFAGYNMNNDQAWFREICRPWITRPYGKLT